MEVARGEAVLDKRYRVEGSDCCLNVQFEGYFGGFVDQAEGDLQYGDVYFWLGRVRPFGAVVKAGGMALQIYEVGHGG